MSAQAKGITLSIGRRAKVEAKVVITLLFSPRSCQAAWLAAGPGSTGRRAAPGGEGGRGGGGGRGEGEDTSGDENGRPPPPPRSLAGGANVVSQSPDVGFC